METQTTTQGFAVTISAPESLQWDTLVAPAIEALRRAGVEERQQNSVVRHYAYLLRLHSWRHGLDWSPTHNKITVAVPNTHAIRATTESNGLVRDGLTATLKQVFSEVSLEYVLKHFEDQDETVLS